MIFASTAPYLAWVTSIALVLITAAYSNYNKHREVTESLRLLLETQNTAANEKDAQMLSLTREFDALQKQMIELSQRAQEQERKDAVTIQEGLRERALELERRNDVLKTQMAERDAEILELKQGLIKGKDMLDMAEVHLQRLTSEKEHLKEAGLDLDNRNHELVAQLTEVKAECQRAVTENLRLSLTNAFQTEVSKAHREAIVSSERKNARKELEAHHKEYKDKILELEDKLSESLRRGLLDCPRCSANFSYHGDKIVPISNALRQSGRIEDTGGIASSYRAAFSAPERFLQTDG